MSDDLLRVQVKEERLQGVVYALLRSAFGRAMLRSTQYGSIIKHLEPEHLHDVPIPLPSEDVIKGLQERVERVYHLREEAYEFLKKAETLFASALGKKQKTSHDDYFSVRAAELFRGMRRLDAHHYNPTARAAEEALVSSKRRIESLGSVTKRIFGVPRFKHVYTAQGTPYLDSEDLFKINPELTKFIPHISRKDATVYFVERRWLLMACSGQLYSLNGSVVLAEEWHERKIISNHVIRIVPSEAIRPGYLQMALGHPVFSRPLVLREAFGTEVPEIAPEALREFPVVRLSSKEESEIAEYVERSSALRMEASQEEDATVRYIEERVESLLSNGGARRRAVRESKGTL